MGTEKKHDEMEPVTFFTILEKHKELTQRVVKGEKITNDEVVRFADQILSTDLQDLDERQFARTSLCFWSAYQISNSREGIYENICALKPL